MNADPMCPATNHFEVWEEACCCEVLAAARADERARTEQRLLDAWETYVPVAVVGAGYGPWLDRMLAAARGEDNSHDA